MARDIKQLMVEVPTTLAEQLQRECEFSGMTKGSIVRRALELYLGQLSSETASESLAILREALDYPDRRQFADSAIRHYVKTRLQESPDLSSRFEEVKRERERAANRIVHMKEARKE